MTLAEIEELAREVVHVSNVERRLAEMDDVLLPSTDRENLARFILRALPVLRAAEEWRELWRHNVKQVEMRSPDVMYVRFPEEATLLADAIDAFRGGDK